MINKQSLWFVTLFSLIIVLSIYYFSTDQTSISAGSYKSTDTYVAKGDDNSLNVLKVANDEVIVSKIDELESILLDSAATLEEKNNAYDELSVINANKAKEDEISRLIKDEFEYDTFVKITDNQISVVVASNIHNNETANKIIKKVQEKFKENKYITVKFEV